MAKVNTLLNSLTGGELSPRLDGRVDLKKFSQGAREILNFTVLPHGGARKRSGTKFVVQQRDNTDVALLPFQFSTEQSYILAFGNNYIWFFKDGGIITHPAVNISSVTQANPAVVTATAHGFSNGDYVLVQSVSGMTEINNRWFIVANKTTDTFELQGVNSTSYTAYVSGGTVAHIVELSTPYSDDEVVDIQTVNITDTLYIVHKNHPLRKLQRASHTSWTLSEPDITTGPFRTVNGVRENKLVPSFPSAVVTNITQANPAVVTTSAPHPFSNGQYVRFAAVTGMTDVNTNAYVVANAGSTTFELQDVDSTGFGAYVSGGTATMAASLFGTYIVGQDLTLTATGGHTPFTADMVGALVRLSEEGATSGYQAAWIGAIGVSMTNGQLYTNAGNVYGVSNVSGGLSNWGSITRVPSHDSGIVRVYATATAFYDANFLHPTYSVVRITGYTSPTVVSARVVRYHLPQSIATNGTSFFEEGAWSGRRGYPRAISFYEQRLFLAGGESDPTVVWASQSGIYENFEDGSDDKDALVYRVPGRSADVIRWLNAGRVLTAGSSFGEYAFASSSQNQALTPSNVKASPQTSYGTSNCIPLQINQAVLYPQRNGTPDTPARKVREFQYRYDQDAFGSTDLTVFSEHILGPGISRIAYQTEPDSIIWTRSTDGTLPACTYERLQEVVAWHRHELGGPGAGAQTIAVIPGDDGDELWTSVERTVAGGTVRYIEVMAPAFKDTDSKENARILDAHASYAGASTTTISGLWHLRGETVKILNNGSVEMATVSASGHLTLSRASGGGPVHIGHGYKAVLETEDFEAGAQAGTAQSRVKRIAQVWLRVLNSLGGTYGPDADKQQPILYRTPGQPMGASPPLYSGFKELDWNGSLERFARVRIEHDDPTPMLIAGMTVELNVNG